MVTPGSWFVGEVSRNLERDDFGRLAAEHAGSRLVRPHEHVQLLVAPESETCVMDAEPDSTRVWCGSVFLDTSDGKMLLSDAPSLRGSHAAASGQFAAVHVRSDTVSLQTDANRLRSVYLLHQRHRVLFATHLHLLSRLAGRLTLNPERFGSHWFCWCQLSGDSFIDGVRRVVGRQRIDVRIAHGEVSVSDSDPVEGGAEEDIRGHNAPREEVPDPIDLVQSDLQRLGGKSILALSGGLDSRLLLAMDVFDQAFVFGSATDMDVILAQEAARAAKIPCDVVPDQAMESCLKNGLLALYARDNWCISPATAVVHMGNYHVLGERFPGRVFVDGGFGEISRAQHLKRFELLRRSFWLRRGGLDPYISALSIFRCDVFTRDIRRRMNEGVRQDVEQFMDELAHSGGVRPEEDMAAHYRRQNFFGYGQAWIDAFVPNYMPLAQEPFVQRILQDPAGSRRSGRTVRSWIAKNRPALASVALSVGGTRVPFGVPPILVPAARRMRRAAANRRAAAPDTEANPLLHAAVRELVYDTCLSPRAWYDMDKVQRLVDGFYSGNMNLATGVAWLLSLELWLRGNDLEA